MAQGEAKIMTQNREALGTFSIESIRAYSGTFPYSDTLRPRSTSSSKPISPESEEGYKSIYTQVSVGLGLMKRALTDPSLGHRVIIFRRNIPTEQDGVEEKEFTIDLSTRDGRETLLIAYTDFNYYVNSALASGDLEAGYRRCIVYLDDLVRGVEPQPGGGA